MTNVFLYGELRNKFGDEFKFNISSPKEVFLAVNANRKGFLDEIKKLAAKGIFYRIIVDDEVIEKKKKLKDRFAEKNP
jgi:predicted phage tail protein